MTLIQIRKTSAGISQNPLSLFFSLAVVPLTLTDAEIPSLLLTSECTGDSEQMSRSGTGFYAWHEDNEV